MSSPPESLTPWLSIPLVQATLTARKAGWEIGYVNAVSASWVDTVLQSSNVQSASGSRAQSPLGQ